MQILVHRSPTEIAETARRAARRGHDLRWMAVVRDGLGHEPFLIEARDGAETVGLLPLAAVKSMLFARSWSACPTSTGRAW